MKSKGHPIRGAIAGLFFGLFLSLDLLIFGVVALDSNVLAILPLLGLVAGIALGMTAPVKRRSARPAVVAAPADAAPSEAAAEAAPAMASAEPAPMEPLTPA